MRVAYIAAGAAGMYCGSCLSDNSSAAALMKRGHEVALLPTYTPLKTDEPDVSTGPVFYGAVNVYLQHKSALFRFLPPPFHWLLDRPGLLNWVSRFAGSTQAAELGALTLSVLQGEHGPQRGELERLVGWLGESYRPRVIHVTNSLFLGMAKRLHEATGAPVVMAVQGEDLFLDGLPEPWKGRVLDEMRRRAGDPAAWVAPSRYYGTMMGDLLGVAPERMHVVPLGLNLAGHGGARPAPRADRVTLGFLSRICPEKGFARFVDAFLALAPELPQLHLAAAGWLGEQDRAFFEQQRERITRAGFADRCTWAGEVDHAGKVAFLHGVDVLCVPSIYRESKGLPLLEAMANGVPVVVPDHGSLPEVLAATGGGVLVPPGDRAALVAALRELLTHPARRTELAAAGREGVRQFSDEARAEQLERLYEGVVAASSSYR